MKNVLKWLGIGLVGLVVLGAIVGGDDSTESAESTSTVTRSTETTPASTQAESLPAPVSLGDVPSGTVYSDVVTLRGRVYPAGAKVRVGGHRATVHGRRWTTKVTVHRGSNIYRIRATAPGREPDTAEAEVIRRLSSAERAALAAGRREAFVSSARTIPYNQLNKNADRYAGEKVVYRGQILQVQESGDTGIMLLSVTDEGYGIWDDNIWVDYEGSITSAEEDVITVYGTVTGSKSYETQIGGETYVPQVKARYIVE